MNLASDKIVNQGAPGWEGAETAELCKATGSVQGEGVSGRAKRRGRYKKGLKESVVCEKGLVSTLVWLQLTDCSLSYLLISFTELFS